MIPSCPPFVLREQPFLSKREHDYSEEKHVFPLSSGNNVPISRSKREQYDGFVKDPRRDPKTQETSMIINAIKDVHSISNMCEKQTM